MDIKKIAVAFMVVALFFVLKVPSAHADGNVNPTSTSIPMPTATETTSCPLDFELYGYVNVVDDNMTGVQADATWSDGPDDVWINFFGGPDNNRLYHRGDIAIPQFPGWDAPRLPGEDYELTLTAFFSEEEICDTVDVIIPAGPAPTETPTLTVTPTLSPTETITPTETAIWTPSPTETDTPGECIVTDIKGQFSYEGNHMGGNPVTGLVTNLSENPECQDGLYILAFGSDLKPGSDGWLESQHHIGTWEVNVPPGTIDKDFSQIIPVANDCWLQVDLLRTDEVRNPPKYSGDDMVEYVFLQGLKPGCEVILTPTPVANTPTTTVTGTPPTPSPTIPGTTPITPTMMPTSTPTESEILSAPETGSPGRVNFALPLSLLGASFVVFSIRRYRIWRVGRD